MSLSVNGVWKTGVWNETVYSDGVWREGVYISQVLIGNKMFAQYVKIAMTVRGDVPIMVTEFKTRDMIA